jgi:hypothetical protein
LPCGDAPAGGDLGHGRELAVQVVLADEHEWQLVDDGEVHALVEVAVVGGAVAEEGDRYPPLALSRKRGAERRGDAAADDPRAKHQAVLEVDHVH